MQRSEKLAVLYHEQRRQAEHLVALHQARILLRIDPHHSVDRQPKVRQLLARIAAGSAALAGKDHHGGAGQIEQSPIGIKIGQFQLRGYTRQGNIILMAIGVPVHASLSSS